MLYLILLLFFFNFLSAVIPRLPEKPNLGFCPNGQTSLVRCSYSGQCGSRQSCMNGLCCTTKGNRNMTLLLLHSYSGQCGSRQSCMNGLCCTTKGNNYQFGCFGAGGPGFGGDSVVSLVSHALTAIVPMVPVTKMFLIILPLFFFDFLLAEEALVNRSKRQLFNMNQCLNGGMKIGVGCYFDYQCTPYAGGRQLTCSNYCCCTVPTVNPPNPGNSNLGYCYNGQRSSVSCSGPGSCGPGQSCMNGLCCTTTGNEYQFACGGSLALGSCTNGGCASSTCVTSNYCCECQYGRTTGLCANGCQYGYSCNRNGYCCPQCPNGAAPYGSCYNGQCASGYSCRAGNICCR